MNEPPYYDRDGLPIGADTRQRLARDRAYATVAITEIAERARDPYAEDETGRPGRIYIVSTVWGGIDLRILDRNDDQLGDRAAGDGPLIFATSRMTAKSGPGDKETLGRYTTREQAYAGHQRVVDQIAAELPNPIISSLPPGSEPGSW